MHNDEEATHTKLTALLTEAVHPAITGHGGRIVKNTGDGLLAEFPSAVEAVRAALQFQTRIRELTVADTEDRRIAFRVGINIGDVIVEPHDIFGDGVNIAARLEGVAGPGNIAVFIPRRLPVEADHRLIARRQVRAARPAQRCDGGRTTAK